MRVQLVAVIASIGIVFGSWHESDVRARYANGGLVTVAKTWASAFGVRAAARSSYSDTTPPVIVASVEPPADASGWHHADVHITWAVQDPESGIAWVGGGCQDQDVTADTSELALTCNASNGEGLIASSTVTVRLDKTLPVVALSMGTTLGEPIVGRRASISAHAVDNHAIARVEFFIDGAFSGSDDIGDGHGNYSATVDSTMFSDDAPPPIKAVAYDVAGNSSTAQSYLKIANRGLVAAYNFEEGNVTRVFDSAVHSSGVASNDGAFGKGVSRVPGVSGQALMFDGRTGFVTIPDSASLDVKHMTLMAWVKPTTITGWQTVVLKQATPKTSSGLAYSLYANSGQGIGVATYVRPSGWSSDQGASVAMRLVPNVWQHLAATYDGNELRLFVNGSRVATTAVQTDLTTSTMPLFIGGNKLWGEFFAGAVDEVRIYDHAFTDAEVFASVPASTRTVTVVDIGTLGGDSARAVAVNDRNQVVGCSTAANGETHAFLWQAATGMADLGTLGGGYSCATAINAHGLVAGQVMTPNGEFHVFLWDAATGMRDLGFAGVPMVINAQGHTIGHNFFWSPETGMVNPPIRVGGLNDADEVVGDDLSAYAKLWRPSGEITDLGQFTFIHGRWRTYSHVNNQGEVAARYRLWPVLWSRARGLLTLSGADLNDITQVKNEATAISNSGDIVGVNFYWNRFTGMIQIAGTAWALNDHGLVVGSPAFVWSPATGQFNLTDVGVSCVPHAVNNNGLVPLDCNGRALILYVGH